MWALYPTHEYSYSYSVSYMGEGRESTPFKVGLRYYEYRESESQRGKFGGWALLFMHLRVSLPIIPISQKTCTLTLSCICPVPGESAPGGTWRGRVCGWASWQLALGEREEALLLHSKSKFLHTSTSRYPIHSLRSVFPHDRWTPLTIRTTTSLINKEGKKINKRIKKILKKW